MPHAAQAHPLEASSVAAGFRRLMIDGWFRGSYPDLRRRSGYVRAYSLD